MDVRRGWFLRTLFPERPGQWFGPAVAAGVAVAIGAGVVTAIGLPDVSASKPHPQGWARFLHSTFENSVGFHSRNAVPPADLHTARMVEKGATLYARACSHCHGGPGLGQNALALAMMPTPQYLVTEAPIFDDKKLFYIVKHGVKYSAMPAWPVADRDDEVWSLAAFVRALPGMSVGTYQKLAYGESNAATPEAGAGGIGDNPLATPVALPNAAQEPKNSYRYTAPSISFGDYTPGRDPLAICAQCHGVSGAGRASGAFPNLALLNREYIASSLRAYAAGTRRSGFMVPVATALTGPQIDAIAAYYAKQPRTGATVTADPAVLALGARIAEAGFPARKIGACTSCHGLEGASHGIFSALDGQYPAYLRDQLKLFRARQRGSLAGYDPMVATAHGMTDAEIDAVSLYYASRPPAARPAGKI